MINYTIYCTEEQVKKALKLGAPIEVKTIEEAPKDWQGKAYFTEMDTCAKLPTAEQMIGWLEEQGIIYDLESCWGSYVNITVWDSPNRELVIEINELNRKEATIEAIDAALEYLTTNKK